MCLKRICYDRYICVKEAINKVQFTVIAFDFFIKTYQYTLQNYT